MIMNENEICVSLKDMIKEIKGMKSIVQELRKQVNKSQKHGEWLISSNGYHPYCSECREEPTSSKMTVYCDHCGAIMDGKKIK